MEDLRVRCTSYGMKKSLFGYWLGPIMIPESGSSMPNTGGVVLMDDGTFKAWPLSDIYRNGQIDLSSYEEFKKKYNPDK